MLRRSAFVGLLALAVTVFAGCSSTTKVPLQKGDRVVFLGDSITQQGGGPKGYVTLVKQTLAEKKADLNVEVVNAGISGHKVPDLQKRLDKDVIEKKPTLVFIYIGINDVWHWDRNNGTKPEAFEAGLKDLLARINAVGAKAILCTPSVIGEQKNGANKHDKMLDEYSDISRKVAKETGTPLLDLRAAFVNYLKDNNPEDKAKGILTSDTVHLNEAGNQFVAKQMLCAMGVE